MKTAPFFKGLSWLLILNLLVKPVWIFFIDRQMQNIVGHEAYGQYFALLNLSVVLSFLTDMGLGNMANQRLAAKESLNIRLLLGMKLLLILFYVVTCFIVAMVTNTGRWDLLIYIILIQALNSMFLFARGLITAQQLFTADAWLSVIDKLLMILLAGAMIYGTFLGGINLLRFLQVQLASTAVAVLIAFLVILYKRLLPSGGMEKMLVVAKRTFPFAIILFLMGMHYRLDGFLLERIHVNGAFEAGMYAASFRILDAANVVGYLAASFLVPFIARNQYDRPVLQSTLVNVTHGLLFFGIAVSVFCISYAPWITQLLYHTADSYMATVLQFCIASLPAYLAIHVYGSSLVATGRFAIFNLVLLASVIINIVLNLILIPGMGAKGCSIAAIASQYFCATAVWAATVKRLNIGFDWKGIISYLLLGVLLAGLFYAGKMLHLNVWLILAFSVLITTGLLALRINNLKNFLFKRYA
ncbi:MAG TPA: polysaccharide biosynthesis C-terminal domain-containing protein [Flavisolibacter sp.]